MPYIAITSATHISNTQIPVVVIIILCFFFVSFSSSCCCCCGWKLFLKFIFRCVFSHPFLHFMDLFLYWCVAKRFKVKISFRDEKNNIKWVYIYFFSPHPAISCTSEAHCHSSWKVRISNSFRSNWEFSSQPRTNESLLNAFWWKFFAADESASTTRNRLYAIESRSKHNQNENWGREHKSLENFPFFEENPKRKLQ